MVKKKIKDLFIREWERERQHEWKGQRKKENEPQTNSMLSTKPDTGLNPGPEPKSEMVHLTDCATLAPLDGKMLKGGSPIP